VSEFYDSLRAGLTTFFEWVPNLIGAVIIIVVGYLVAKGVGLLIRKALEKIGANRLVEKGKGAEWRQRMWPGLSPAGIVSKIVFWFIFLIALLLGLSALRVEALTDLLSKIIAYLPNVVVALLILVLAFFIAGGVAAVVRRVMGGTMFGKVVAAAAPAVVVALGFFMALTQLKIATPIVVGTYIAVIGSLALGAALAFGLGGRKTAEDIIDKAYREGKEKLPEIKAEPAKGDLTPGNQPEGNPSK